MFYDKVIVTDVDGCLLDWNYSFEVWMKDHGHEKKLRDIWDLSMAYELGGDEIRHYIKVFNESAQIAHVPPLKDAMKYVKKLHEEHGYIFHCITAFGTNPYAVKAREYNLRQVFGKTVFEKIMCIDTMAPKDEVLFPYKDSGCVWIEDKPSNAKIGSDLGMNSLLMAHDYNTDAHHEIKRVDTWREIYDHITGET